MTFIGRRFNSELYQYAMCALHSMQIRLESFSTRYNIESFFLSRKYFVSQIV